MKSAEILNSFLDQFLKDDTQNTCFINSPNTLVNHSQIFSKADPVCINLKENFAPLEPFLTIIKNENLSDEIINENVYPLLQPAFLGYLTNGIAGDRKDIFQTDQTFYEKIKIRQSILLLLKHCQRKVYLLENSQCLGLEALEIIKKIENCGTKIKLIFSFDIETTEFTHQRLYNFYQFISNSNKFIQIYEEDSSQKTKNKVSAPLQDIFDSAPDIPELLKSMRNLRHFLAIDQLMYLCKRIIMHVKSYKIPPEQKRKLYYELGLSFYYASNPDSASLYFNLVTSAAEDDELTIKSIYYLSNTYLMRRMNPKATKYASLALQKLKKNPESDFYAYALRTIYFACDRVDNNFLVNTWFEACKTLKEHQLWDNYCTTASNVPTSFLEDLFGLKEKVIPMLLECAEIERKLKNEYSLSEICNVMGFIYSRLGDQHKSSEWYLESNILHVQIGEIQSIIRVKNSLSYEYLITTQYKKSYDILNSLLSQVTELDDYASIADTLRNVALPLFYSRDFENAFNLLNLLIYIVKIFDFADNANNCYVPEINDLIIYKTIIEISRKDFNHAEFSYYNIINSENKHYSRILKPFLHYIKAASLLKAKKLEEALNHFEEGFIFTESDGTLEARDHTNIFIIYEFARLLEEFGYYEKSAEFFQRGFTIARALNFSFYTKNKDFLTLAEFDNLREKFEPLNLNLAYMKSRAEKNKITNDLHARILDAQFTNKIMSYSSKNISIKKYVNEILKAIIEYTAAEAVYYVENTNNSWQITCQTFNSEKIPLPENPDYYFALKTEKNISFDKSSGVYFANLSKFKYKNGVIILPSKKNFISSENIEALNVALSNLQNEITMKRQQETLIMASTIDPLTKLNNRQTLMDYIEDSSEKIRRNFKKYQTKHQTTVCFIDLDNFKYYNDTYGHSTGDFLLKRFSEVLMNNYRRVDFLARFGGDEFMVILPETSCENAGILAERLFESLKERKYFIPELEAHMNKKLDIPEKYHLSFSMGICSNFETEEISDLKTAIKLADNALYIAKKAGKSTYRIWNNEYENKIE